MLIASQFSQSTCGVVITGRSDSERQSQRPVRAHLEYLLALVPVEDAQRMARERGNPNAPPAFRADIETYSYRHALGVVATDHAGYCSFDLEPAKGALETAFLPEKEGFELLKFVTGLWIAPLGANPINAFGLNDLQSSPEAFLVYLDLPAFLLPSGWRAITLPSMQTPRMVDWRFSAGSFAANPKLLIGSDGCETILPAQHSLRMFRFAQIVRFSDVSVKLGHPRSEVNPNPPVAARLGIALEYRTDWYHLGHSLGQILFSQPLAPCETVKLAVINWSRQDSAQRTDAQTVTENLLHEQYRDRIIEETVDATLREEVSGGSFMAGLGLAGLQTSKDSSSSGVFSLGGGTSSSEGTRTLASKSVQNLTDRITQATSVRRDLYGTVVIQANQAEQNKLETRSFTNNNHCHALTILYYEILRHVRVVTRWTATRPIILIEHQLIDFSNPKNIRRYRRILEAGLLEPRLASGFDSADKLLCLEQAGLASANSTATLAFSLFRIEVVVGWDWEDTGKLRFSIIPKGGAAPIPLEKTLVLPGADKDSLEGLSPAGVVVQNIFRLSVGSVRFADIAALRVQFDGNDQVRDFNSGRFTLGAVRLHGLTNAGEQELFCTIAGNMVFHSNSQVETNTHDLPIRSPDIAPFGPVSGVTELDLPEADRCALARLKEHLVLNSYHYSRMVWLTGDANERADLFDRFTVTGNRTLLDVVDNRPLEVLGHAVAFPITDEFWQEIATSRENRLDDLLKPPRNVMSEALLTVPTRGVFGEAKLGHCNSCEDIDDSKYWQWQDSPCGCNAPDITDVSPGPRGTQPDVQQSTMPAPVVNIVNPPVAPDPTGLAAALKVLGTANIFRDRSMATELGSLLNTLAQQSAGLINQKNSGGGPKTGGNDSAGQAGVPNGGAATAPGRPTVSPSEAAKTDNFLKKSGADPATKQVARNQNALNAVGLPKPDDPPRVLHFDVRWWAGGRAMSGDFEVVLKDHNNAVDTLGPYSTTDGTFSAVLPGWLWNSYREYGDIASIKLIARNAKLPARSVEINIPSLVTNGAVSEQTLPATQVLNQPEFSAVQLEGTCNKINKPGSGSVLRFAAFAAAKVLTIQIKGTVSGGGKLTLEGAPSIQQKIAAAIPPIEGFSVSAERVIGLAFKAAAEATVGTNLEVSVPIEVMYLTNEDLTVEPQKD